MAEEHGGISVFDLTPYTAGATEQRRTVLAGIEVKWKWVWIGLVSSLFGIALAAVLWQALESIAILAVPICVFVGIWLFNARSRKGMQLTNARTIMTRIRSHNGVFYLGHYPFDPLSSSLEVVRRRTVRIGRAGARPTPGSAYDNDEDLLVGGIPEDKPGRWKTKKSAAAQTEQASW